MLTDNLNRYLSQTLYEDAEKHNMHIALKMKECRKLFVRRPPPSQFVRRIPSALAHDQIKFEFGIVCEPPPVVW